VNKFRQSLEDATMALYGEVSVRAAGLIYAAMQALRVALGEQREIDTHGSEWTPEQRTAKCHSVLKALTEKNRNLRELGLPIGPAAPADPFEGLGFPFTPPQVAEPAK
jgi:hypothetical protein